MTKIVFWFFIWALFLSCGKSKPIDSIEGHQSISFHAWQNRLINSFLPGGFVIAKDSFGDPEDQGDSLLFTGLALGVVDCEHVPVILSGLERMQSNWQGYLVRFDPLPGEYIDKKNFVSRDGATGVLFGFAKAKKRCPDYAERIEKIRSLWKDAIGNSLFLYPNSLAGIITPSFTSFMKMAEGENVDALSYEGYHLSSLTTALLIKQNKSACYPIHLQTIQHITIEQAGHPLLKRHKDQWCSVTGGMGLLLTDWYCGRQRQEIEEWLKDPEVSSHVYMHQRCNWESSDSDGKESPRIDFLLLHRLFSEGSVI